MKLLVLITVLSMSATVMAAKKVNQAQYEVVSMEWRDKKAERATKKSVKMRNEKVNVIIMPFSDDKMVGAEEFGAGKAATGAITTLMTGAGVQVVDRQLSEKLKQELIAIEQSGESMGVSYDLADFVFKGEVTNVAVSESFTPAERYYTDDGTLKTKPTKCQLTAVADVSVLLYNLNPLSLQRSIPLSGKDSDSFQNVKSCRDSNIDRDGVKLNAIRASIMEKKGTLQNIFAATGRIIEKRAKKKSYLFMTTMKPSENTRKGVKVNIYKIVETENVVTKEVRKEKFLIGTGKTVNADDDKYVWISVKKKVAPELRLGDVVVTELKDTGIWGKTFKNFMN